MQAATRELLRLLGRERDTQVAMPMTYLCYLIPDEESNTSVGNRRLNWSWYWSNFLAELGELLIDKHGQRQTYAVSPGAIQLALGQRQVAEDVLPPISQ